MRAPEIVAELSANHLGDYRRAVQIAEAAAAAGADLFKVQVWQPDTMCINTKFVLDSGPWSGRRLIDLYREAWTPWEWLPMLFAHCRKLGMEPFGAAFDAASVDYLDDLGVRRHKVASFELVDLPLIRHMASKCKPMILSTGMASHDETVAAVAAAGRRDITLLACTSAYPAHPADAGLTTWSRTMGPWGLSDHAPGIGVSVAAVALGAVMIEKHLTLARADGGPDAGFSLEPAEFASLVVECRRAWMATGQVARRKAGENPALRRSLWVSRPVDRGEPLVFGYNVVTARPALGLPCSIDPTGRIAARDLSIGEPLTAEMLA